MADHSRIIELGRQLGSVALRVLENDHVRFKAVHEDEAPSSLESLLNRWLCEVDGDRTIAVSNAHSDRTVFGAPEVNHAFRAWHDWAHIRHRLPFTPEGEHAAYLLQLDDMRRVCGAITNARALRNLLWAEVVGQVQYELTHGEFPDDQVAFVVRLVRAIEEAA